MRKLNSVSRRSVFTIFGMNFFCKDKLVDVCMKITQFEVVFKTVGFHGFRYECYLYIGSIYV